MTEIGPLEAEIRRRIAVGGPMPVAHYMELCLTDPERGYYARRDPFGVAGDFITSPEISQMFGELIGLWAAATWRAMGSPGEINLVELGPGRGTMMVDVLRAARVMPDFRAAIGVHLIEITGALVGSVAVSVRRGAAPARTMIVSALAWFACLAAFAQMPLTFSGVPFSRKPAVGMRLTNLWPSSMSNTSSPCPPYSR